jgi:hypothetical protein
MNEFNDRMSAQRRLIQIVNRRGWNKEELFSLSARAIDRWLTVNCIDPSSRLVELVREASKELLCLATKSQEQISEDYRALSSRVDVITEAIRAEVG